MSDLSSSAVPPVPGPELGAAGRVIGVFTSPAKTFESIARKPGWDWLLPVFLLLAAVFAAQTVMSARMDVDQAVKLQMKFVDKMAGANLSAEKRAEIETQTRAGIEKQKNPVRRALTLLVIFIPVLLVPLMYHGIAAAFGKKTTYKPVLSGYAYTSVIQVVPQLLTALVAWPREHIDINDMQYGRVLKANVGAFLDFDTTNKALLALASSIDVFDIWAFFIGSLALSKTTRFSPGSAKMTVGSVWILYILVKMVFGALYSSFLG